MERHGAYDIDDPGNIAKMFVAMKTFLEKNTANGVFVGSGESRANFNVSPGPALTSADAVRVRFDSVEQFEQIHRLATEFEDDLESRELDDANKSRTAYRAWPLMGLPTGEGEDMWVILVEPQPSTQALCPKVGASCQLRVLDPDSGKERSTWWTVRRLENHFDTSPDRKAWAHLLVFTTTLSALDNEARSVIHPLVTHSQDPAEQADRLASVTLSDENAIRVGLFFCKSDATFIAEMAALKKLVRAATAPTAAKRGVVGRPEEETHSPVERQQLAAFRYLIDFSPPPFSVDVFSCYPNMRNPQPGRGIPPSLLKRYRQMDKHQRKAYNDLLSSMPCGLGILPGGPGSGKTDWALTVIGLMQCRSKAKVLYLLDINKPLDDTTARYVKMVRAGGLKKLAVRMRSFGTELKASVRLGPVQERALGRLAGAAQALCVCDAEEPKVDFSKNFLPLYSQYKTAPDTTRDADDIVSLDDAAWNHYESNKDDFPDLTTLLETCNGSAYESRVLRSHIYQLYEAMLQNADFVATTPCVAATYFRKMFAPDLVVFDESAHARELSALISIANFCPKAGWIFIGDHRQTQPTVKSNRVNPHARQLATSSMERAHLAGVLPHQLLINHRAYSGLERLPSKLIYEGKMVSGIPRALQPAGARFVKQYFSNLMGRECNIPRLIVHLLQVGKPVQVGTSWEHARHLEWTMSRVLELLRNKEFCSAGDATKPGTILLLAPYKAAIAKYQVAIKELAKRYPEYGVLKRVEARTWDCAQGHEADIVGIDYVRDVPTDFMDGMYRFNVGLTRARQGEWHLIHPDMPTRYGFAMTNYIRKLYHACKYGLDGLEEGHVVNFRFQPPAPAREQVKVIPLVTAAQSPAITA